jgi:hypothetical protein
MGFREQAQLQVEPGDEGTGRVVVDAVDEHLDPNERGKRLIVVERQVEQGDDVVADALATFSVKP